MVIAEETRRPLGSKLTICALLLAGLPDVAHAAPFDFLFGGPPPPSRVLRQRRHPALRPPTTDVPLPPPRPHFIDDTPTQTPAALPPPKPAESATPAPPQPIGTPASSESGNPVEPGRRPEAPATPNAAAPQPEVGTAPGGKRTPAAMPAAPPLPPPKPAEIEKPAPPPPAAQEATKPSEPKQPAEAGKTTPGAAPMAATPPAPASAGAALPAQPPTPPPKPADVGPPSTVAPSGATTAFTPRAPEDNPQCPSELAARHVDAAPIAIGPQPDARCTVVEPVRLAEMTLADGAKVAFPDHPTIACTTADSFTAYVRELLVPLAKGTFGSPVTAVWTGPGLECRSRDSIFGAKLSAHGQGLAIDIAQLKLADGRLVEVGTPKTDAETGFETAARAGACGYFHTVLGPGSDAYHRTHWHFDLEVRGAHGDSKYCK